MDRLTQLRIERKLSEGLASLPLSSRSVIGAWYSNAIEDVETGRTENKVDQEGLKMTMEAVNYATKGFRQGG